MVAVEQLDAAMRLAVGPCAVGAAAALVRRAAAAMAGGAADWQAKVIALGHWNRG